MMRGALKWVEKLSLTVVLAAVAATGCRARPEERLDPRSETPIVRQKRGLEDVRAVFEKDALFLVSMTTSGTDPQFEDRFGIPFTGANVLEWMGSRISAIQYSDTPLFEDDDGVIAMNLSKQGPEFLGHILIGPSFFNEAHFPQIARAAIVLHEARHSDGYDDSDPQNDSLPHSICPEGFEQEDLRGDYACDENTRGSYGYQALFLKEVLLHCSNCSNVLKRTAAEFFADAVMRHPRAGDRLQLLSGLEISR